MNDSSDMARITVACIIIDSGPNSIQLDARQPLISKIKEALDKAYTAGKKDAIDTLFPAGVDWVEDSPFREVALKTVLSEDEL